MKNAIESLKKAVEKCNTVIIGAGAGLSASAGFTYDGERFRKHFSDFQHKYGFNDMYTGGFFPYKSKEEYWAYWSRYIFVNRYMKAPKPVYEDLYDLIKEKDYFVITTNVDHCFQKAGFDKKRLFYTQGDYGLFQCSVPCHTKTYDNKETVMQMINQQKDMKVPSRLMPKCPVCGADMTMNLRADDKFVEDEGWHRACGNYRDFLLRHRNMPILFLELGVGYNTPVIIKYPFWQMTAENTQAVYVCINFGGAECPEQIESRSICINDDIADVLSLLNCKGGLYHDAG
ncbi:MAG TPA: Sir2 silent information regulator family NAD-dependent deacetylase [Candidatus Megamonas gallistercoris]|nr:Sir2 silent information regulator family NAD-dependent deacetylase [Candidatus Megamonas gallistercoris]